MKNKNEVFKVGDVVYHIHNGKGVVFEDSHTFMIGVKFGHHIEYVNMYELSFKEIDTSKWHIRPEDLTLSSPEI